MRLKIRPVGFTGHKKTDGRKFSFGGYEMHFRVKKGWKFLPVLVVAVLTLGWVGTASAELGKNHE